MNLNKKDCETPRPTDENEPILIDKTENVQTEKTVFKMIKLKITFNYILSKAILFRDWRGRLENELACYDVSDVLDPKKKINYDMKILATQIIRNRIDDEHLRIIINEPYYMIERLEDYCMPKLSVGDIPIL